MAKRRRLDRVMTRMLRGGWAVAWIFCSACAIGLLVTAAARADDAHAKYFNEQVKPVLIRRCLQCHGADRKGELDLRTKSTLLKGGESGEVVTPGEPDQSLLIDYVSSETMPPNKPLSEDEVKTLTRWVADGVYFPEGTLDAFDVTSDTRAGYDWWSLQPLADATPPEPGDLPDSWAQHPIDRFVYAKLRQQGLHPSPPADKRTLIRRATYDLTGLPPTPAEIAAFEADDRADAYERLVDRLLASPHYGEQWGRHWLDVVRFGESNGFERNQIINNAWPYRDYIIRSFNEDKPFNRLIREQLAGDVIGVGQPDVEVGTTFLACGPYDDVGNQDPVQAAQIRANTIDEMIRATSETFLGLTVRLRPLPRPQIRSDTTDRLLQSLCDICGCAPWQPRGGNRRAAAAASCNSCSLDQAKRTIGT